MLTSTRLNALRRLAIVLQVAGFLLVAGVIWLDESIDLPHLLFRASPTPFRPEEAVFEMLLLGVTAAATILVTSAILRRLAYVEALVRFCPSCQRVLRRGEWTSVSDFFQDEEAEALHYGVCPDCAARGSVGPVG
jgi:hypothetical protein